MKSGKLNLFLVVLSLHFTLISTLFLPVLSFAQNCQDDDNFCPVSCSPDKDFDCFFKNDIIFKEDFEANLTNWQINSGSGIVEITNDTKYSGAKSLRVFDNGGGGISVTYDLGRPLTGRLSVYFYDDLLPKGVMIALVTQDEKRGIGIGVNTNRFSDYYYYRTGYPKDGFPGINSFVKRTKGWHRFELIVTPRGAYGRIDGITLSYLPGNSLMRAVNPLLTSFSKIKIVAPWGIRGNGYFDSLAIQPLAPVPSSSVEREYHFVKTFLSSYEKQGIDIVNWALNGQWWVGRDRVPGQTALAYAIRYLKEKNPSDLDKAKTLIQEAVNKHSLWGKQHLSGSAAYPLALSSWLLWPYLDSNLQNSIRGVLLEEAEFWVHVLNCVKKYPDKIAPAQPKLIFHTGGGSPCCEDKNNDCLCDNPSCNQGITYQQGFSRYKVDTSAEDNGVAGLFLGLVSQMFNNPKWENAAKTYSYHLYTISSNAPQCQADYLKKYPDNGYKGEYYGGICSRTLYDDFTVDNHGYHPHPGYSGLIGAHVGIGYLKLGKNLPYEFRTENMKNLWNRAKEFIDFSDFSYRGEKIVDFEGRDCNIFAETSKDDWGGGADWVNFNFASADKFFGDSVFNSLTEYEYYIKPDVLAFHARLKTVEAPEKQSCWDDALYHNLDPIGIFTASVGQAERHAISMLLYDSSILLNSYKICEENFPNKKIWDGNFVWQCDGEIKREGEASLKLTSSEFSDAEVYSPLIPVKPNQAYKVSYWVKTRNLVPDTAKVYGRIIVAQYNENVKEEDEVHQNQIDAGFNLGENVGGTTDWVKKSYTFVTNSPTKFIRLRASLGLQGRSRGEVWFDEVRLEESKLIGDLNNDGVINAQDIKILLSKYLTQQADLNSDGKVNSIDFGEIVK
jgi:hypothetical protein